jgi:hypothetical protein
MSDEIKPLSGATLDACAIATGEAQPDPSANAIGIRAAAKDLNAKGNGPIWYRMVWRGGRWSYFASERLPSGNYLAADRRATVHGDVYPGELVCQHARGEQVDAVWIVRAHEKPLRKVEFTRTRDGLRVQLPTGAMLTLPDPRAK